MPETPSRPTSSGPTLRRDALNTRDLLIAGMSYMAPGFSFFFTTAIIVGVAGAQAPLAYLLAGIGVLAAASAFAEFSRHEPSAGSLQVFIERGFGRRAGLAGGLALMFAYVCLAGGVLCLFGGWTSHLIDDWTGVTIAWPLFSVVGCAVATLLMVRGVGLSIKATWVLFLIEFIVLVIIIVAVLLKGGAAGHTFTPFDPFDMAQGWSGIGLAMVFAVFSYIGFEGSVSFAEETPDPRRAVPISVLGGVAIMSTLYVVGTYAAVVGFGLGDLGALTSDAEPVATLASRFAGPIEPILEFAVFTSVLANMMAAGNANTRILFNMGREGSVFKRLGAVHPTFNTPAFALVVFMSSTAIVCLLGAMAWEYQTAFGNVAGLGSLIAIIIYMASTIAVPVYIKSKGLALRPWRHVVLPVLGAAIWLVPLYGSLKPGQAFPANIYPVLAVAVFALAAVYAWTRRTVSAATVSTSAVLDVDPGTEVSG